MAERITIEIATDNDAFTDAPASEIARVLLEVARGFRDGDILPAAGECRRIKDANGNTCGCVRVSRL